MESTQRPHYEMLINHVIVEFYKIATLDPLIGYQFEKIHMENKKALETLKMPFELFLKHHIPKIVDFWNMILLREALPQDHSTFNLLEAHFHLNIKVGEVHRWVVLFKEVLDSFAVKYPQNRSFFEKWWSQIQTFQKIFLNSKKLFPK